MENNEETRWRLYEKTRDELIASQLSNAEAYDKSLLTLSSAFLGISFVFIKDIVPLTLVHHVYLLIASWVLFASTIVGTIFAFIYGQRIIKRLLDGARKYYIDQEKYAHDAGRKWSRRIDIMNEVCGIFFIAAVIFLVLFVVVNLPEKSTIATETTRQQEGAMRTAPVNKLNEVPAGLKKSNEKASLDALGNSGQQQSSKK